MMLRLSIKVLLLAVVLFIGSIMAAHTWGFYGHKRINRMAVFTLPPEMLTFYKQHIDYLTEHAVDPDKRRYAVDGEAPRHYIDIDHYAHHGENVFDIVPRKWNDAVEKLSEDTLQAYGIVPWHVEKMVWRLTRAFKNEDLDKILRYSAELGHYVGDAHVPLHTTENYNGQLTNQKGIHGFWESRLPEMFATEYDYFVGRAEYIDDVNTLIWEVVYDSHMALDSVLTFERELNERFPSDRKYAYEQRGVSTVRTYSQDYATEYHTMLNGQVERRMRTAIRNLGNLWYTAWVDAGQPDLERYNDKELTDVMKARIKEAEDEWKARQKIKGREHAE